MENFGLLTRGENVLCDLGAFELIISNESVSLVGESLTYGQTARLSIVNSLGDGELIPASECSKVMGQPKAPDGSDWQVGCLRIEQASVTPISKGISKLSADGELEYRPNSNWHGLDQFSLRVVTTTSRFSDAEHERDILVPVRILQNPPNDFKSDTIDVKGTSGGAFGILGVMGLFGLGWIRRKFK